MDEANATRGFIFLFIILILYFVPWLVAVKRRHHQVSAIFVTNLFLGWTFLGWVAALVWAFSWVRRDA